MVSDIPAGDGNIEKLFFSVKMTLHTMLVGIVFCIDIAISQMTLYTTLVNSLLHISNLNYNIFASVKGLESNASVCWFDLNRKV